MKFEVKVQYRNVDDDGKEKVMTTVLLIEAELFGEAEAKAYTAFGGFQGVVVKAIKVSKIAEVVKVDDQGTFFECGIQFISVDEKSGKAKQVKHIILVQSENSDKASITLKEHLGSMVVDYEIVRLAFSPISEIVL